MKKLLLLSTLFLALSCTGETEESQEEALFLEINDGKGFVNSTELTDNHIFFYDSDIFLKEVFVSYPELNSFCLTTKEGSNTDINYGTNFTAEITNHIENGLDVRITYSGDNGNTVYQQYSYTHTEDNDIIVYVDGIRKTYSATSITYASLCN